MIELARAAVMAVVLPTAAVPATTDLQDLIALPVSHTDLAEIALSLAPMMTAADMELAT